MKRILSIVICILMLFVFMVPFSVYAESAPSNALAYFELENGDEIWPLSEYCQEWEDNYAVGILTISLYYDGVVYDELHFYDEEKHVYLWDEETQRDKALAFWNYDDEQWMYFVSPMGLYLMEPVVYGEEIISYIRSICSVWEEVWNPETLTLNVVMDTTFLELTNTVSGTQRLEFDFLFDAKEYNQIRVYNDGTVYFYTNSGLFKYVGDIKGDYFYWTYKRPPNLYLEEKPSADIYSWLKNNVQGSIPVCDGTTCHVADFDINGVCDTCGSVIAYSVKQNYRPSNFPTELPDLPLGVMSDNQYIVFNTTENILLYIFTPLENTPVSKWTAQATKTSGTIRVQTYDADGNSINTSRRRYEYNSSTNSWYLVDSQSVSSSLLEKYDEVDIVYSTLNIYDPDGKLFFPLPLWMELEQESQREIMTTKVELGEVLMILTTTGLGLLALLILLRTLVRVLKTYLPQ